MIATEDVIPHLLGSLEPMLAMTCEQELQTLVGTHWFDEKLDGIRALVGRGEIGCTIRNRNGRDMTATWPEVEAATTLLLQPGTILDGEITALHGSFQDIAARDRRQSAAQADTCPAKFTAFDILHHPERGDVRHWRYQDRRALLDSLGLVGTLETSVVSPDPDLYEKIKALGGEGIVAKRLDARYSQGRKRDWLKYKATRTVSCIAVGYEPGKGSRANCGAFLLAMIDENNQARIVGRVGSGFTETEIAHVKAEIDRGIFPILEIRVLGRTREDKLRQPVHIGLRTDLAIHDVVVNQLNALPRG